MGRGIVSGNHGVAAQYGDGAGDAPPPSSRLARISGRETPRTRTGPAADNGLLAQQTVYAAFREFGALVAGELV